MDLNILVAKKLAGSSKVVAERVVEILAEKELVKLTNAVMKVLGDLNAMEKEIKKIKPDMCLYGIDKKLISENWSKEKLEALEKKNTARSKLEKALQKALEDGEYKDLLNLDKQNQKIPDTPDEDFTED